MINMKSEIYIYPKWGLHDSENIKQNSIPHNLINPYFLEHTLLPTGRIYYCYVIITCGEIACATRISRWFVLYCRQNKDNKTLYKR